MRPLKLGPFITAALFKGKTKNYKALVTDANLKGRINGRDVLGGSQSSGWARAQIEPKPSVSSLPSNADIPYRPLRELQKDFGPDKISRFDGATLRICDRFPKRPRKALHSI